MMKSPNSSSQTYPFRIDVIVTICIREQPAGWSSMLSVTQETHLPYNNHFNTGQKVDQIRANETLSVNEIYLLIFSATIIEIDPQSNGCIITVSQY